MNLSRADFPALHQTINGHPLTYLDNAATAQKPQAVTDAIDRLLAHDYANVHRGVHTLSQRATEEFEAVRTRVRRMLNAADEREIIFTKGCTESINLVAQSYLRPRLRPGDEILLTELEHHSNIVPWQLVAEATGAVIRVAPIDDNGVVTPEAFRAQLSERTRMAAFIHVSNALGTVTQVAELTALAHRAGAKVLVDGAQAGPHLPIDVQSIGADFYTLSCHKHYTPTGVGVLYGRLSLLEDMPPYQGGGSMIDSVTFEKTTYAPVPAKFEPGTPNIVGVIGMGAALDALAGCSDGEWTRAEWVRMMNEIDAHERSLRVYGAELLRAIPGVRLYGEQPHMAGILSFTVAGVHPHDVGTVLDSQGVAVRAGHHCCQPLMRRLGVPATVRASLALYNQPADLQRLAAGVRTSAEVFA
jgi:cysteine desulfurase/selenocysteine lyase